MDKLSTILKKFFPFWLFLTFFKFGGGLHYTILAPLGEKVMPLWLVGTLVGVSAFIQLLLDVPAGYLLDRYGYRKLLKLTTLIFAVASAFFVLGLSPFAFILSLAVSTFGWLFFGPGSTAYIAGHASKAAFGRFTSTGHVFASAGIVLASAVIPFVVMFDAKAIGAILCALFSIAYVLICISPKDARHIHVPAPTDHPKHRMKRHFLREAWKAVVRLEPASILIMTAGFAASTFYAIIWFVVPLLIAHQAESGLLGLGLGVFDFSVVALGFFLGTIVDRYDKKMLVGLGLLIFALAGIFLGFNFGLLFLFLGFIATTGDELSSLALWAWLYKIDTKHENYGLISGTISLFEDIGWTIGPIIAGVLYGLIGPTWTIAVGGLLIVGNLIIFLFLAKHPIPGGSSSIPLKPHRRRYKH
jgi:MFS family permease